MSIFHVPVSTPAFIIACISWALNPALCNWVPYSAIISSWSGGNPTFNNELTNPNASSLLILKLLAIS